MPQRLTWLGQAGFRIELDGATVVIDPWLSPHDDRLVPPPPVELAADGVDVLLVTHEHLDHLDVPFLPHFLERSADAPIVLPGAIADQVDGLVPESRLRVVDPGDVLDVGGLELRVTPAVHGVTPADAYGDGSAIGGRPRFVGYVLGRNGRRIYHAGDTLATPELTATLEPLHPEVMLLPINGRDTEREARGIVGNMDASEAVELALAVSAQLLVPIHWDGFRGNTVPPGSAVDAADGRLHVLVPARDRPLEVEAIA